MTGRLFLASGALPGGLVCSLHAPAVPLLLTRATVHEIAEYAALMSVAFAGQMVWRMMGSGHPMGRGGSTAARSMPAAHWLLPRRV